ncbi:hypothetical protein AK812_SmicGene1459 [Symbiodinium microadriaticum]|uniref:Uncharacterized protein n=1 Tax=Symbiodinium microadriaticum TaxID=2951 RepID=A0A1Q9F404_SYMMI|nr:hypothetical protein AK812_SmicGene1459 [Symbiodinium microadriaticum]
MLVVGHGGPKWISPSLAKQMDICRIGTDLKAEDMLKQEDPYLHREAGTAQRHARDLHRGSCVMAFWRDRKHIEGASAEELRVSLWGLALGASQRREKYARKAPAGASAGSRLRSASWQNREDRQGDGAGMRQPGAGAAVLLKLAHAAWGCSAAEGTDANDEHMALNAGVLVLRVAGAAIFLARQGRGQVKAAYSPAPPGNVKRDRRVTKATRQEEGKQREKHQLAGLGLLRPSREEACDKGDGCAATRKRGLKPSVAMGSGSVRHATGQLCCTQSDAPTLLTAWDEMLVKLSRPVIILDSSDPRELQADEGQIRPDVTAAFFT